MPHEFKMSIHVKFPWWGMPLARALHKIVYAADFFFPISEDRIEAMGKRVGSFIFSHSKITNTAG